MEEKLSVGSAMVSRLPKFGGRSSTGAVSSLPNGSPQTTTPSPDAKPLSNGAARNSFSLKWRRDAGSTVSAPPTPTTTTTTATGPEDVAGEAKPQTQLSLSRKGENGTPGTPKMQRSGSSLLSISSPKAIPKQTSKTHSPKAGTKLAQSPLSGAPKASQNGSSAPIRPRPLSGSESRLVRPRASSSLHLSGSQDSLTLPGDTLAMDNMVRSHSFTHFKQIPSPTSQPMTRSFSFNRAVELAKPLANTNLRPPNTSFLKPPQLSNGRVGLALGGLGGSLGGLGGSVGGISGVQYSRAPSASVPSLSVNSSSTPTPPSALKKPLLPTCVATRPSGSIGGSLGYRLVRPGQVKQKPLFTGRVKGDVRAPTAPGSEGKSDAAVDVRETGEINKASHSDSDQSSTGRGGGGGVPLREGPGPVPGEALEDMSLSSASSLERGDTSEDFLDEVDSGADTFSDGDLADSKSDSITQQRLRNFLSETMDWSSMDTAGCKADEAVPDSQCTLAVSPEGGDLLQGSSLELSPSNSSGGTYMWDEEGLEPLGGAGTVPCDSNGGAELSSMAILSHLDALAAGELDDDLMLEVELPEDFLLHHDSDRMSSSGRTERPGQGRQGHWRRKQHRWNGQDHFINDNRAPLFQHYDDLRAQGSLRVQPQPSAGWEAAHTELLDELTLRHMAQDCSSLKNQLLKLKTLLQFEDEESKANVEESEESTTALQFEELMKEVEVLREELMSRDKTIAQLSLRCHQLQQQHLRQPAPVQGQQGRCQCHHQRPLSALRQMDRQMDRRAQQHHDKATQTHLRTHNQAGVQAAPLLSLWQAQHQGSGRTGMPQRKQTSNTSAFQPPPQRALAPGKTSKSSHRGPQ